MLKSLFFKQKEKTEELLPPPPPFPSMELEDEGLILEKPKEAEEPEEDLFKDLFADLEEPVAFPEKRKAQKAKKLSKKELKKLKELERKQKKASLKPEKGLDFELPEELESEAEFEPEKSEDLFKGAEQSKPKELAEAEEEIKSAIESLKVQDRPSLFKKLFTKKAEPKEPEIEIESVSDGISVIQNKLEDGRKSLMNLDLENAKMAYIEIMSLYNKLKPEDQAKVYNEINEFYHERRSAEQLN